MGLSRTAFWGLTRHKGFVARRALRYAYQYIDCYHDYSYKMRKNGERNLLDAAASTDARTVFDVGANVGEWSLLARPRFPNASIHAFELSATTYRTLSERLTAPCFVLNNVALAAEEGPLTYMDRGPNSGHNSIIPGVAPKDGANPVVAHATTGDAYCEKHGIDAIDFLKIDVEGAEHLVLGGFRKLLGKGRIRCIQFEYGYANGDAKFLMRDFYGMLENHGYAVGKVWARGVGFEPFSYPLNDFRSGPNFCAVQKNEKALIERLRVAHTYK